MERYRCRSRPTRRLVPRTVISDTRATCTPRSICAQMSSSNGTDATLTTAQCVEPRPRPCSPYVWHCIAQRSACACVRDLGQRKTKKMVCRALGFALHFPDRLIALTVPLLYSSPSPHPLPTRPPTPRGRPDSEDAALGLTCEACCDRMELLRRRLLVRCVRYGALNASGGPVADFGSRSLAPRRRLSSPAKNS